MKKLQERLSYKYKVIVQPEPSVTIPFINDVLNNFYNDNERWSYPLQLMISSAQEVYMEELRGGEYDYALFDAAYSSDIYGYSHSKHGRMKMEDFYALLQVGRPFKFDVLIWIDESAETIKKHILDRNNKINENGMDPDKKDLVIEDLSYIDKHLEDFGEYFPIYMNKFKSYNDKINIITVGKIPDVVHEVDRYNQFLDAIIDIIEKG